MHNKSLWGYVRVCACVCFQVFLTQVVLPALQCRFLQGGSCSGNVHMTSVVAGQRHFEYVLQHLPLAVHQLRPHPVHCLQQQLSACRGRTVTKIHTQVSVLQSHLSTVICVAVLFLIKITYYVLTTLHWYIDVCIMYIYILHIYICVYIDIYIDIYVFICGTFLKTILGGAWVYVSM